MATNPTEIELPFGPFVKATEWGEDGYVYDMGDWFAITRHPHAALEAEAKSKFKIKAHRKVNDQRKEEEVIVSLPYDFAKKYLWESKVVLTPIQYGDNIAITVWNPSKGSAPTIGPSNP